MARARATAAELCAFDDLSHQVDWNRVRDAQRSVKLPEHDYAALATMTAAAARRWALRDLGHVVAVEQRVLVEVPENPEMPAVRHPLATKEREIALLRDGARLFKGFVDLELDDEFATAVDWKTTSDAGPTWRERLQHSWQGKLYCWATSAKRFIYRGVQRDGRTAEVVLNWPVVSELHADTEVFGDADADNYVRSAFAIRDSQRRNVRNWAQHAPYACGAYGRRCEHYEICQIANAAPGGQPPDGPLSHSSIENLLLCPERYRLGALLAAPDTDADDRTALGSAFHLGVAELWLQLGRLG